MVSVLVPPRTGRLEVGETMNLHPSTNPWWQNGDFGMMWNGYHSFPLTREDSLYYNESTANGWAFAAVVAVIPARYDDKAGLFFRRVSARSAP